MGRWGDGEMGGWGDGGDGERSFLTLNSSNYLPCPITNYQLPITNYQLPITNTQFSNITLCLFCLYIRNCKLLRRVR